MTSIEETNKLMLHRQAPTLYDKLYLNASKFPLLKMINDSRGMKVSQGETECYISSIYDRNAELKGYFDDLPQDVEFIIYIGGLSVDVLQYVRKKYKRLRKIFFVEPAIQLLQDALTRNSLQELFMMKGKGSVSISPNLSPEETLKQIYDEIGGTPHRLSFVTSIAYETLFGEYCNELADLIGKKALYSVVNISTDNYYFLRWIGTRMKNAALPTYYSTSFLPVFQGRPVILVSAGPSLKKNVELLREVGDKAIIVAVGSGIFILNKLKISRHFNAAMDSMEPDMRCDDFPNVPLLYEGRINPESLGVYTGPKINFISAADSLGRYLQVSKEDECYIPMTGFSIAVSVADLVIKLGASALIFIGQDMCFYDDRIHHLDEKSSFNDKNMMHLKDIYGNDVLTSPVFWGIKQSLEVIIQAYPDNRFINATEGGLGVDGVENMSLRQALDTLPDISYPIQQDIYEVEKNTQQTMLMEVWEKQKVTEDLEKIKSFCVAGLEILKDMDRLRKNKAADKKLEKKIALAAKQMNKINEIEVFRRVIAPTVASILGSLNMLYDTAINDSDRSVSMDAQVKKAIGAFMPIYRCCKEFADCYNAWKEKQEKQHI